jgi:uncharacterized membrane protein
MNKRKEIIIGRAFAFSAALAYAVSAVLVRQGLAGMAPPLVGAAVSLLAGGLVIAIIVGGRLESNLRQKKGSVAFLLLAGVASGCGVLASFFALSVAPVVIVSPVQSTSPLFALVSAWLFLGRLETITFRLVLGTIFVVTGVILITIGKGA